MAASPVVSDTDEQTIVNLLAATPSTQVASLLSWLQADKSAMLKTLESVLGGSEYREYHQVLRTLYLASLGPAEILSRAEHAAVLPWSDPGIIGATHNDRVVYDRLDLGEDGQVAYSYWLTFWAMPKQRVENRALDPFALVKVRLLYDEAEIGAHAGDTVLMPAVSLLALGAKQFRQDLSTAVDVALLVSGGVGLAGAATKAGRALAALDLALGATAMVVNEYRNKIAETESGRRFLEIWDVVQTVIAIYAIGRVLREAPEIFRKLRDGWSDWRRSATLTGPQVDRVDNEVKALLQKADDAEQGAAAAHAGPDPAAAPAPDAPVAPAVDAAAVAAAAAARRELAGLLMCDEALLAAFDAGELERLRGLARDLSRDRRNGLRTFLEESLERGRRPNAVLKGRGGPARGPAQPDARRPRQGPMEPRLAWKAQDRGRQPGRGLGAHPSTPHARRPPPGRPPGDLFPRGVTRPELEKVAGDVIKRGTRIPRATGGSRPSRIGPSSAANACASA